MAVPKTISNVMKEGEARNEWDPALTKVLLDNMGVNVRKLSDSMYAFADEKDPTIKTIVQAAGLVDLSAVGQVSKLRQAIITLKKAAAEAESLLRKGADEDDLDQPLDSVVLSKLVDSYYERYKILLPAVVHPCDTSVSRLARDMEERHLTLRDVWDTRTQDSSASNRLNAPRTVLRVTRRWSCPQPTQRGSCRKNACYILAQAPHADGGAAIWLAASRGPRLGHCPVRPCPLRPLFGIPHTGLRSSPEIAYICGSGMGYAQGRAGTRHLRTSPEFHPDTWCPSWRSRTRRGTHPRGGQSSSTTHGPKAAARAKMVTSQSSRHRARPAWDDPWETRFCGREVLRQLHRQR